MYRTQHVRSGHAAPSRIDPVRARAFEANLQHYSDVFIERQHRLRHSRRQRQHPGALAAVCRLLLLDLVGRVHQPARRSHSYTNNWPYEPLVGNRPTGETVVWTGVSIIMLLAGICAMVWWYASQKQAETEAEPLPETDPLGSWEATPSQRATVKYFWVVSALILVQILLGVITAHYGVEGDGFYGFRRSKMLPYSVTRTWHVQLGLFWIATAWLAAGLFIGPLVSGYEPQGPAPRRATSCSAPCWWSWSGRWPGNG